MTENGSVQNLLDRWQRRGLVIAVIALGLCAVRAFATPAQFFHSYLLGYLFWLAIGVGSLGILMLHHLTGGGWGYVIRRPLEAATRTLPVLAVLFLPLLLDMKSLYLWARPEAVAADELLQHKAAFLNVPFFVTRAFIYFTIWLVMAYLLNRWSREWDATGEAAPARRLRMLSGPGILIYGLTMSFAAVDWVMSLEPHWFSTIYGMLFVVGQGLATLAFMIPLLKMLSRCEPLAEVVTPQHFHNLGNLLLAFTMLWAYLSFSQYLIIWSGNLAEEIPWYLHRLGGGWQTIALLLVVFHFAVPFLLLLIRTNKRKPEILAGIALGILALRWLDLFWLVAPAFTGPTLHLHWMDLMVVAGLGGLWFAAFTWQLKKRPLLAVHDPSLEGEAAQVAEA